MKTIFWRFGNSAIRNRYLYRFVFILFYTKFVYELELKLQRTVNFSAFHSLTVTGVNEWTISLKTALKAMKILQTVPVVAVVPSWMNLSRHDKCFFGPCWTPRRAKSFLRGVIISVSVSSELVTKGGVRTRTHQIYFYMKWKDINIARSVYQRPQKRLPRCRPPLTKVVISCGARDAPEAWNKLEGMSCSPVLSEWVRFLGETRDRIDSIVFKWLLPGWPGGGNGTERNGMYQFQHSWHNCCVTNRPFAQTIGLDLVHIFAAGKDIGCQAWAIVEIVQLWYFLLCLGKRSNLEDLKCNLCIHI